LSSLLSGEKSPDALQIPMPDVDTHPNFSHTFAAIKSINTTTKHVEDSLGQHHRYDRLILATGARAHIPDIPGNQATGVYTFRNMKDTQALYSRLVSARHVVVVGGGVLGIEAAKAMSQLNTKVTLIQQGSRLMNRQLDDEAAAMLAKKIEASGIRVITNSGVREIYEDTRVTAVRTYAGEILNCDTVLLSAGIRPNIEMARRSGLKTARGIQVDDQLRTSVSDIWAIGECSEHRGKTYGLVGPGFEQAGVVADVLTGGSSSYLGSTTVSRLKIIDEDVVSLGQVCDLIQRPRQYEICFRQVKHSIYRKLVVHKGALIGAVGYGDWPEFSRVQEVFQSETKVKYWQILWFFATGRLWLFNTAEDVKKWPATALVCQCNQVTRGQLTQALELGYASVAQLCAQTRAGTACGSCKPLLAQFTGAAPEKAQSWKSLLVSSLVAIAAVGLMIFVPQAQVSETVQVVSWFEEIWNDKFWKQVTGFSLLAMVAIGMLMSFRKRLNWIWMGSFSKWRLTHTVLGTVSALLIFFHTGFNLGQNLNQILMLTFLTVLIMGASAGLITGLSHILSPARAHSLQKSWAFLHLMVTWPLPALLIVHVLSVYFF
jgi:nitrite reductase (NADH) large subunit